VSIYRLVPKPINFLLIDGTTKLFPTETTYSKISSCTLAIVLTKTDMAVKMKGWFVRDA
jgi:hypothetical protein